MITRKNITKKQAKHILKLLEQITRAEIMARLGRFDNLEYINYATIKIDKENKLREYLYGSSNLAKLGKRWDLIKKRKKKRRKK